MGQKSDGQHYPKPIFSVPPVNSRAATLLAQPPAAPSAVIPATKICANPRPSKQSPWAGGRLGSPATREREGARPPPLTARLVPAFPVRLHPPPPGAELSPARPSSPVTCLEVSTKLHDRTCGAAIACPSKPDTAWTANSGADGILIQVHGDGVQNSDSFW